MKKLPILISFLISSTILLSARQIIIGGSVGGVSLPTGSNGNIVMLDGAGGLISDSGYFGYSTSTHTLLLNKLQFPAGVVGPFVFDGSGASYADGLAITSIRGTPFMNWTSNFTGNPSQLSPEIIFPQGDGTPYNQAFVLAWGPPDNPDIGISRSTFNTLEINIGIPTGGVPGRYGDLFLRHIQFKQANTPLCSACDQMYGSDMIMEFRVGPTPTNPIVITPRTFQGGISCIATADPFGGSTVGSPVVATGLAANGSDINIYTSPIAVQYTWYSMHCFQH